MGISFDKAFGETPANPPVKPAAQSTGLHDGLPFDKAFSAPQPTTTQKLKTGAVSLYRKLSAFGQELARNHPNLAAGPQYGFNAHYKQLAIQYTDEAIDQVKNDFKNMPDSDVRKGGKIALDALNALWAPVQASLDTSISEPIRAGLDKAAKIVSKYQEYSPAERRKAWESGAGLKDSNELESALKSVKELVEPALNAATMVVAPESALEREGLAARDLSRISKAVEHLHGPLEPAAPKAPQLTFALDNTMGFQGIRDHFGDVFGSELNGKMVFAPDLLDRMLPHAQGYAKELLQKLRDRIDQNVKISFVSPEDLAKTGKDALGFYLPSHRRILIKTGTSSAIHTVVHEMVHAVTVHMLDTLFEQELKAERARFGRELTQEEKLAVAQTPKNPMLRELDQVIAEARLRAQKAGVLGKFYGLNGDAPMRMATMAGERREHWSDPAYFRQARRYEFLAEVFTNPKLQEFLANSEKYASTGYKFKNMLNQLGLMIGKHLGFKNPHTLQLLNQSLRVGDQLMRMQYEGGAKKDREFYDVIVARTPDGEVVTKRQVESATEREPQALGMTTLHPGGSIHPQGIDPNVERYEVVDGHTGKVVGTYDGSKPWARRRARALADKKDGEYGAYRYQVRPVRKAVEERPDNVIARVSMKQARKEAENTIRISIEGMLRAIHPEGLGAKAKQAAAVVSSRLAEHAQNVSAWRYGAKTRTNYWRANAHLAREFIEKFEKGEEFSDPILRKFAAKYRDWNKRIFEQDQRNGFNYEARDNYLYHIFTDSEGVAEYFQRKYGAKWGDPRFLKDRVFDLYKEAIAAGFTPKFESPEDIMLARQQASDLAAMNIGILNDLASYGLATRKIKGGTKLRKVIDDEGKVSFAFDKIEGNKQPENTTRWRAPNGDIFWVDNQAHVILENAFRTKSLWSDKSILGAGFRGMMTAKNLVVPIRLSLSLFHPLHIVGIDIASGMTRQLSSILAGDKGALEGFAGLLKSGFDPFFKNPKLGWKVLRAMRGEINPSELNATDAEALQHIIDGGLILDMSAQYRTNARQNFMNALLDAHADYRGGKTGRAVWDVTKATWHAPWALLSAIQAPIFEHWIPMLKGASYLQDAQLLLKRNPELMENRAARQVALRKLAKSAENRYGEMAYNTLFWKRWIKDLAVMNTLSLGWQMGFLREYGGGAMDLGQFARGGAEGRLKMIKKGLLDRPLFVASYTTLGAAAMGLMTYGMTGTPPSSLLDYIDPRVGGENADGSPKRVSTMFYSREFVALDKHIQDQGLASGLSSLVMNKSSGLFGLMHEFYTGVNSFGEDIRDPNADLFTKTEQTLAYVLADMEPISIASLNVHASTGTTKDKALAGLGFTPAPKYVTETKTEATITDLYDRYVAPKETPFDRAEYSQEFRTLKKYYESGDARYGNVLGQMVEKYQLGNKDIRRLIKTLNLNLPGSVKMFIQLPWQQQKVALDKMTPEERDQFILHANKEHLRYSYQPPEDQQ